MRLLLYNPNTDRSLTARLETAARACLGPGDSLETGTADRGASFIGTEATIATARAALAAALPPRAAHVDAVLLGCFGDLGLDDIRAAVARPVLSLSDACFMAVAPAQARFALLTTSAFWADRLAAEVERRALTGRIVTVRSMLDDAPPSGHQLVAQCRAAIAATARRGEADAVILAGALLAVLRDELAAESPMPIFDVLGAGLSVCRSLAAKMNS